MNTNVENVEVNEVVSGDEVVTGKSPKLSKTMLSFKEWMEFHYPDEVLDYTRPKAEPLPIFVDPVTDKYYRIYTAGVGYKNYVSITHYVIAKVTSDGEVQFSDRPKIVTDLHTATVMRSKLERKYKTRFTLFGISEADFNYFKSQDALIKTEIDGKTYYELKVVFRPNSQAK
jgi:hypothetical protein